MELEKKITALMELEELIKEAEAEAENLKDEIRAEMARRNTEEMRIGRYIVRWTSVVTNRFDTNTFKRINPETYKIYLKQTMSRRFSISK
jgi:predicted phage-related endonuclease